MKRQKRNWLGLMVSGILALASLVIFTGCADDLYASCNLASDSQDAAVRFCGSDEGGTDKSCVVENQAQCDTLICGRFNGSDPFCTKRCSSDADCPAGICTEFVFQSGVNYCVEEARL